MELKKNKRIYAMKVVKKELVNDDEVIRLVLHYMYCKLTKAGVLKFSPVIGDCVMRGVNKLLPVTGKTTEG